MTFEICNFLFNYVILNFNQAVLFLKVAEPTAQQYKESLQKLQAAVWGAQELGKYGKELQTLMKVPLEYESSSIEFLIGLMNGLGYLCVFNILLITAQGKVADESLASLEREISNCFYVVKDVIKNNSAMKKLFKDLNDDVLSKYYEFGINCLVRVANSFEVKQAEVKTKGHIGYQYAYLLEAIAILNNMDKDSFKDKKELQKKFDPLRKKAEEVKIMIDQVFKCPIPKRTELNDIKPLEHKVRPLEPKNIRIAPANESAFSSFISEEVETTRSSLTLFVTNKRQHVEKTMFDLNERIQSMNQTYNVPFLRNCGNLSESIMTDEFKNKILLIREKGESAFKGLVDQNLSKRQEVENLIGELDNLVNRELDRDKQMQSMGASYTTFSQAFGEHIQNLSQIKSTVGGYKSMNDRLVTSHNQYKNWLPKLADPQLNINELLKIPDLEEFVKTNGEDLTTLKKLSDGIQMILNQHISAEQGNIIQALEEVNIEAQAKKISMNETDLATIYKDINEKIGPLCLSFEEKVFRS